MGKKSKAEAVIEMLKAGQSVASINRILGVSGSYIYILKKKLAEGAAEAVETVRHTAAEHNNKIKEMFADGKAQSKTTILNVTPEFAFSLSQGRQKRREEAEADTNVDATLNERGSRYGTFYDLASLSQGFKNVMMTHLQKHNKTLIVDQQEALEFILSKIARITNGDPDYVDSWLDIAGYATLVADRLQGKTR
jgi:hypothetical protein